MLQAKKLLKAQKLESSIEKEGDIEETRTKVSTSAGQNTKTTGKLNNEPAFLQHGLYML